MGQRHQEVPWRIKNLCPVLPLAMFRNQDQVSADLSAVVALWDADVVLSDNLVNISNRPEMKMTMKNEQCSEKWKSTMTNSDKSSKHLVPPGSSSR